MIISILENNMNPEDETDSPINLSERRDPLIIIRSKRTRSNRILPLIGVVCITSLCSLLAGFTFSQLMHTETSSHIEINVLNVSPVISKECVAETTAAAMSMLSDFFTIR
jgi:hypothetical protein